MNYPPFKIVVSHNNESVVLPPKLVMLSKIVVIYPTHDFIFVEYLFVSTPYVDFV